VATSLTSSTRGGPSISFSEPAAPLTALGSQILTARKPILDRTFVVQRTDGNTPKAEARRVMRRKAFVSAQPPGPAASTDCLPVPLEVFYVVQTTGGVIGRRHHRICPPLYETPHQAQIELLHLRAAASGSGTYSVWKATTYIEPAEWLYDVVIADGSLIRPGDRQRRRTAAEGNRHESRLD
jgi:hypothetical protein